MRDLVSVIIPSFNGVDYIDKCLDSVVCQTYGNIEIIVVDDGSSDNTAERVNYRSSLDDRIRLVSHENNKGLFQARLTGVENAKGDYLVFVDSDDYISCDYVRCLLSIATKESCEIVMADVLETHDGIAGFYNLSPNRIKDFVVRGDSVSSIFLKQNYTSYEYHCVCGKLYSKALWERALPKLKNYSSEHPRVVMWEDLVFSSVLWNLAGSAANNSDHNVFYYYVKHIGSSTMTGTKSDDQKRKHISDCYTALSFFMTEYESTSLIEDRDLFFENACITIANDIENPSQSVASYFKDVTGRDINTLKKSMCDRFPHVRTTVGDSYFKKEELVKTITSDSIDVVSFDVFDTLIVRQTLEPRDIFAILSNEFNFRFGTPAIDFSRLRVDAEVVARKRETISEDITLDDIYHVLADTTELPQHMLDWAKAREVELELRLCKARKSVKELYEIAVMANKKVIVCSDMYLSRDTIASILTKAGYRIDVNSIFVSSDIQKCKGTSNLYKHVQAQLAFPAKRFVHVGDNRYSDYEQAIRSGWKAYWIPKCSDSLMNTGEHYSGNAFNRIAYAPVSAVDTRTISSKLQVRLACGLIANRVFDDFGITVNPDSDFNASPQFIGYGCLGPHVLAVCQWIKKIVEERHIPQIVFVARDGYLVKQAFDMLYPGLVQTDYIRVSRKAMLLADVSSPIDLYSLFSKMNISKEGFCARTLLDYFDPIIPENLSKDACVAILKKNGVNPDSSFKNTVDFTSALKVLNKDILDFNLLAEYKNAIAGYFANIKQGAFLFDIGYNGRVESAISRLLGFPIGALYIHANGDLANYRNDLIENNIFTFYDHKPMFTGLVRELLFSEQCPTVQDYKVVDGRVEIEFADSDGYGFINTEIISAIQKSAISFIKDYSDAFGDLYIPAASGEELSAYYEYYLHYSKIFDKMVFELFSFEDEIGMGMVDVLTEWNQNVPELSTSAASSPCSSDPNFRSIGGEDVFMDGYFVKLIRTTNRLFPKGSGRRESMKKIANFIFSKKMSKKGGDDVVSIQCITLWQFKPYLGYAMASAFFSSSQECDQISQIKTNDGDVPICA